MTKAKECLDYSALATEIIQNVGGEKNIETFRHCATRLRFKLLDTSKADTDAMKKVHGVMQVLNAMGEYQIVIGSEVTKVYDEVCKQTGIDPAETAPAKAEEKPAKKKNIGSIVIDYLGSGLGPFLGAFTAGGIMKGLLVIATLCGVQSDNGLYIMFSAIADTIYY